VRTNRPINAADPRHRKPGPARLGGEDAVGKRARDLDDIETSDEADAADTQADVAS
jgi:hypothetical protein